MAQAIKFSLFLSSLHQSVLSAAKRFAESNQRLIDSYLHEDRQTAKSIVVTGNNAGISNMEVPLLAIAPLVVLGMNTVAVDMSLSVFVRNGELWVSLSKDVGEGGDAYGVTKIQTSLHIDPNGDIAVFLETAAALEQQFLTTVSNRN
jgi:hypothetical protein